MLEINADAPTGNTLILWWYCLICSFTWTIIGRT